jgi:hypothetical protein
VKPPGVEERTPPAAGPGGLPCPYPGCPGVVAETDLHTELLACRACRRLLARCPRVRQQRCRALNRPLARYCRHCGGPLEPGWAEALWARTLRAGEAAARAARKHLILEGQGHKLASLEKYLPADNTWVGWSLGFLHVAGRLWVGAPDGRHLFLNPFAEPGEHPVVWERLWHDPTPARLRAKSNGTWLVFFSEHGLKALNLVPLEDPGRKEYAPLHVWTADATQRLVSEPVFLPGATQGEVGQLERRLAWVTAGPEGLVLWLAVLSAGQTVTAPESEPPAGGWPAAGGRHVQVRQFPLSADGKPLAAESRVALVEAPFRERLCLALATRQTLWLLEVPAATSGQAVEAVALLTRPRLVIDRHDLPGLAFVPALGPGETRQRGTLFVSWRDEARTGGKETLQVVAVTPAGLVDDFSCLEFGGGPIAVVEDGGGVGGTRRVLCLAGDSLVLTDASGIQRRVQANDYLLGTWHGQVYQGVCACTGMEASEGQRHWFVLLADLRDGSLVQGGLLKVEHLEGPPVLLGDNLFTLERAGRDVQLRCRRLGYPVG